MGIIRIMKRRGQTTLEYVYIIGVAAAAIVTILVYISRGLQGNIRAKADQIGAGQYEPGKTTINNTETKHITSTVKSENITSIRYGDVQGGTKEMRENQEDQKKTRDDLEGLEKTRREIVVALDKMVTDGIAGTTSPADAALEGIDSDVGTLTDDLEKLGNDYIALSDQVIQNEEDQEVANTELDNLNVQKTVIEARICAGEDEEAVAACEDSKAADLTDVNNQIAAKTSEISGLEATHATLLEQRDAKKAEMDSKKAEIDAYVAALADKVSDPSASSEADLRAALLAVELDIVSTNEYLTKLMDTYELLSENWHPYPDVTTTTSTNTEGGTLTNSKGTSEALETLR